MEHQDAVWKQIFTDVMVRHYNEIDSLTPNELETRWYFQFDPLKTDDWNLYEFHKCLDIYSRACRRWEETHNGNSSVVERVRDKYLLPKINAFLRELAASKYSVV